MSIEKLITENAISDFMIGGITGALVAIGIIIALVFILAIYIYFALAWMTIAKKLNYKRPWLAWIPIANIAMILELGGFHWAWIFIILIPIAGWVALAVLSIIATWKIFGMRKYPGWFSLSIVIPKVGFILYMIAIGFVAWSDKKTSKANAFPIKKGPPTRKATIAKKKTVSKKVSKVRKKK
jgi:hypothetical protein